MYITRELKLIYYYLVKLTILIVSSVPIFLWLQLLYILVTTSIEREQQPQDQSLTNTLSGTCTLIEI